MEEQEFRRLLDQFPIVRSRNYCADLEKESSSHSTQDKIAEWKDARSEIDQETELEEIVNEDPFWQKLRSAAEEKVGHAKAVKFCKAFQTVHKQLVYEKLSLDAARKFLGAKGNLC